jgi:hypothetical protein
MASNKPLKVSDHWSAEEYRQYCKKQQDQQVKANNSKYKNFETIIDGIKFDSKKEAEYYGVLKLRVKAGELKKVECHVAFPLIVNGVKVCDYEADFVLYYPNGTISVKDVKSNATEGLPVFRLKARLMSAIHKISVEIV